MAAVKRSIMLTGAQDAFVEEARERGWKRSLVVQLALDMLMRNPPLFLRGVPTEGKSSSDKLDIEAVNEACSA